jgi:hypothetical protein
MSGLPKRAQMRLTDVGPAVRRRSLISHLRNPATRRASRSTLETARLSFVGIRGVHNESEAQNFRQFCN